MMVGSGGEWWSGDGGEGGEQKVVSTHHVLRPSRFLVHMHPLHHIRNGSKQEVACARVLVNVNVCNRLHQLCFLLLVIHMN